MAVPLGYERKIFRIGHSFAVTLPDLWCKAFKIDEDDTVNFEAYEDRLVITKGGKWQKKNKRKFKK